MKSKKATKRALLSSALSLVLCFSMLLGTTFAWFTDEAKTGVNTIKSGTLKVDLVSEDGKKSVKGETFDTLEFVKAAGASADEAFLWEPGCTYVTEGFQVENLGDLWLKYQLVINGIDGDAELLDVIDFWITDNNESLEKAVELGTYLGDLAPETKSGVYYLVGHMDENAENEYQGLTLDGVGVTVYATQKDAEYDSFGPNYDTDATHPEIKFFNSYSFDNESDLGVFAPAPDKASGLSITPDGKAQIDAPGAWYTIDADLSANEYSVEYDIDITNVAQGQNVTVDTGESVSWGSTPIMLERGSTKVYYGTSKNEHLGTLEGTKVHVTHTYSYNKDNMLEITTTVSDGVETVTYTKAVASAAKTTLYWDIYYATDAGKATMDNFTVKGIAPVVDSGAELAAVLAEGGKVVLGTDIVAEEPIVIPAGKKVELDLNGKTISGDVEKSVGHVLRNEGNLTIVGGTVESTADNGGSAIYNAAGATLTLEDVEIVGAPQSGGSWPSYAINCYGNMIAEGIVVTSTHGAISVGGGAKVTFDDIEVTMNGFGGSSHVFYIGDEGTEVTVNGGTYTHKGNVDGSLAYIMTGATMIVNDGTFSASNGGYGLAAYKGSLVVNGGTFANAFLDWGGPISITGGTFATKPADKYIAEGYEVAKNDDGTYTVKFSQESVDSLIENAQSGDTVEIPAGTYTFPTSKLKEGVILECAEGTVFEGKTSFNINGATVIGASFTNSGDYVSYHSTINGTFKDCTFTDCYGLRYCYAGETVVFENCVFDGDLYGIHFDSGANDVVFKNCTFSGFNTFGGGLTKLTMENCTFKANGKSDYNGVNLFGDTELTNCKFVFDGTASTEWVDLCNNNKTVTFTNCVVTDGTTEKGMETVVGNYGTGNTIIINEKRVYIASAYDEVDVLADAVANGATEILLTAGEYDLNGNQKDGLTLIGVGNDVKMANTTKYASGKAVGAIWQAINLKNVTITNTVYTMADGGNATFTNVNFAAGFRQGYGKNVVFTDCAFGSNSEGYALHFQTDSASEGGEIKLNGCEFEGGKVHLGGKRAYEFTGCDFAAGTDFQVWSNITLKGCTVNGAAVTAANANTFFPDLNLAKVTFA